MNFSFIAKRDGETLFEFSLKHLAELHLAPICKKENAASGFSLWTGIVLCADIWEHFTKNPLKKTRYRSKEIIIGCIDGDVCSEQLYVEVAGVQMFCKDLYSSAARSELKYKVIALLEGLDYCAEIYPDLEISYSTYGDWRIYPRELEPVSPSVLVLGGATPKEVELAKQAQIYHSMEGAHRLAAARYISMPEQPILFFKSLRQYVERGCGKLVTHYKNLAQ